MGRSHENALFSHDVDSPHRPARLRATNRSAASGVLPPRRRRLAQFALVFIGCVLLLDALVGEKGLVDMIRARDEQHALESTLIEARRTNERLREEIRRLKEDPAVIEDLARRELGMIKRGEKLFMLRDVEPPAAKIP